MYNVIYLYFHLTVVLFAAAKQINLSALSIKSEVTGGLPLLQSSAVQSCTVELVWLVVPSSSVEVQQSFMQMWKEGKVLS